MTVLEGAALAPGDDRVPGLLSELQQKVDRHEVDIDNIKVSIQCCYNNKLTPYIHF